MSNFWTSIIAIISLVISCAVAYIEFLNYSLNRRNLVVKYWPALQQEEVVFYNLSMIDAMITHWEFVWVTKKYLIFQEERDVNLYDGDEDLHINVKSRSRHVHVITEQYAGTVSRGKVNSKLYIKIYIAGKKRPLVKFLRRGHITNDKHDPENSFK